MREVIAGEDRFVFAGSPLTIRIYKQAFGTDIMSDLAPFMSPTGDLDLRRVDVSVLQQIAWALCKTAAWARPFPNIDEWLTSSPFYLDDESVMNALAEEVKRTFFRSGRATAAKAAVEASE